MTARDWPTREQWQARAEYAARTSMLATERLPEDARYTTPEEDALTAVELPKLIAAARPALTRRIRQLRLQLSDRPSTRAARGHWFVGLDDVRYALAQELGDLEQTRRLIGREPAEAPKSLARVARSYPEIELPASVVDAAALLLAVDAAVGQRVRQAAEALEQAAVEAEVARRATGEAWEKELERRARIDAGPRVIVHHA